MPKARASVLDDKRKRIRGTIAKGMCMYEYTNGDMSEMLGCSLSTFKLRKRYPENFTLSQIWTMSKVLHFSEEEIKEFTG
ncbi:hypothetical protein RHL97_18995 [Clostridioides difficile]|nr:hypothetical protein [Clostridioides difficile]